MPRYERRFPRIKHLSEPPAVAGGRALYHYVAKTEGPPATAGGSDKTRKLPPLLAQVGSVIARAEAPGLASALAARSGGKVCLPAWGQPHLYLGPLARATRARCCWN